VRLPKLTPYPAPLRCGSQQIKLQVAFANALMHIKGYGAPDTKVAMEQARLFIERAEALGEPPEDPLLLFSVLYGFWVVNYTAFDGDRGFRRSRPWIPKGSRPPIPI
jgi:hypothetical protein